MSKELFEGKWHEFKGKVKEKWGKLTDDDITKIAGKREQLLGKLEALYGYAKDKAEREVDQFEKEHRHHHEEKERSFGQDKGERGEKGKVRK